MSSNWHALHAQLVRSVHRHSTLTHFVTLFPPDDCTRGFRDPSHLLGWLHARDGDAEAKNDVLMRLLRAAGDKGRSSDLAVEILLLALWPGLSAVRFRLRRFRRANALDADLLGCLTLGIRRAGQGRVTRAAATLLRNLERDLRRLYLRDDHIARSSIDMEAVAHRLVQGPCDRPERIVSAAWAELGEDGLLLAAVHVAGFTQKEAGERLGISHDAARKRCQRAIARLNQQKADDVSHSGVAAGFSLSSASRRCARKGAGQ